MECKDVIVCLRAKSLNTKKVPMGVLPIGSPAPLLPSECPACSGRIA